MPSIPGLCSSRARQDPGGLTSEPALVATAFLSWALPWKGFFFSHTPWDSARCLWPVHVCLGQLWRLNSCRGGAGLRRPAERLAFCGPAPVAQVPSARHLQASALPVSGDFLSAGAPLAAGWVGSCLWSCLCSPAGPRRGLCGQQQLPPPRGARPG